MLITAAEVEGNGWVLRLTGNGSLTSPNTNFGAYTLDPSGTPRVALSSSHPGFVKSGGTAVSGTLARSLVGTRPLRLPVNPASPTVQVLDETDLGGGVIRVRLALSEHIYSTDTSLSLTTLAGWRSGASAQSALSVTNNSTLAAPIPIMRWVLAPYETTAGTFRASLLVFSHHPVGFEPVAGVKFTATDGTNTKTVWTTALGTDNSYGDNLRCYTVEIDPSLAPALTAGLLRVDAEVYPWLGSMRTTDPAGTRTMTGLRTLGYSVNAEAPWVIGYDPAGTRYGQMWAYIDPVNGTTTASAAMVATTLAGAKAVPPASRPANLRVAEQAGALVNRTLAAANGQAAQTRSIDGMRFVLAPGTHVSGSTTATAGTATAEIPVRIMGDPDDPDPRANCIWQTSANAILSRANRQRYQNFTMEVGGTAVSGISYALFDNVTVRGKSGFESNTTALFTNSPSAGQWLICAVRTRVWRYGTGLGGANPRIGLLRNVEHSRQFTSYLVAVKNRLIGNVEDGFLGAFALSVGVYQGWPSPTLAGQAEDIILAYNDLRFLRGRAVTWALLPAATAGTPNPSMRRTVMFGNIFERIGTDPEPFYSMGENATRTMTYNIIEANTHVGDRANTFYSDPDVATIADTNTKLNQAWVNRIANNYYDWLPTKHDDFFDGAVAALRGTSDGYRPHMVEAWSMLFGVMHEGNYDAGRTGSNDFPLMFSGPRSAVALNGVPGFTSDGSILGPGGAGATGGGNYVPNTGSPLLARVTRCNSDRDFANGARISLGAAGAFEGPLGSTVSIAGGANLVLTSGLGINIARTLRGLALVSFSAAGRVGLSIGISGEVQVSFSAAASITASQPTNLWTVQAPAAASWTIIGG